MTRPLILTTDTYLLDDLLGMAAAAGVAVDVAVEPASCRPQWTNAPLVLVGAELAAALPGARLRARPGVLLVARGSPTGDLRHTAAVVGAEAAVGLPQDEATVLDRLADTCEPAARGRVIGVLAGCGGAGASVLAVGLALTAGAPAWLIDLDPLGGGADAALGAELSAGARWTDLGELTGHLAPAALREAVPEVHGVSVVSTTHPAEDLQPGTVRTVIRAAGRGGGTVVLDLPRHRTSAREEALTLTDEVLLVVPAEIRAILAARRIVEGLPVPARVVVRCVPGGLPSPEVVRGLGLPFAGQFADEVAVRVAAQVGDAAGLVRGTELAQLCGTLLDRSGALAVAA